MSILQALVLGTVQGLTEFIPVSSSGHLVLVPAALGWREPGLAFDVLLHVASLIALVAYFLYQFLLPTLALILAAQQDWFRELQPWVDFDFATGALLEGSVTSQQWSQLAVTGLIWLVVPLAAGLRLVVRAEVK